MKFTIKREILLKPLQQVITPITGKPLLPIISNILLKVNNQILLLIGTDLEIEMIAKIILSENSENGSITVAGRKFYEICKGLPINSILHVEIKDNKCIITSNRSIFLLSTLPSSDFPNLENWKNIINFQISETILKQLIEATQFSMANHDVRYYLNGMLFEIENDNLRSVATDGHRLATSISKIITPLSSSYTIIIPRKSILELMKLLNNTSKIIDIQINNNNIRIYINDIIFTSKIIDGQFPDYRRVLSIKSNKILIGCSEKLKNAFIRSAILANEKFHSVQLCINENQMKIIANNNEQEKSEEIVDVKYQYENININFNVNYILDVLNVLKAREIKFFLNNANSSIKIENANNNTASYIIMPMRI